jgi:hypothetical protein
MSKNVWGPATWNLLHCMVLKIDDNINNIQLEELKKIISRITHNLPCPYCAEHSASFFKINNYSSISSINALRYFLFYFHNNVNERLKKPIITYEHHIEIYVTMNLTTVIQHFFNVYRDMSQTSVTMMLKSFHRNLVLNELNSYLLKYQKLYRLY